MRSTRSDVTLASGTKLRITLEVDKGNVNIDLRYHRFPSPDDQCNAHKLVDVILQQLHMEPIKRWGELKPEVTKANYA